MRNSIAVVLRPVSWEQPQLTGLAQHPRHNDVVALTAHRLCSLGCDVSRRRPRAAGCHHQAAALHVAQILQSLLNQRALVWDDAVHGLPPGAWGRWGV